VRFKPGDFVKLHGLKAQVESVFHDEGLDGAVICYFPQPGYSGGPGWPRVRQDQLEAWEGPRRILDDSV
jgi:hypothetical protein